MISSFGEYIIYADESGDHSLISVDEQHPVFVLAFCIFKKSDYTTTILPRVNQFKFNFWGHDLAVLHNREIRRPEKDFAFLQVPENREAFFLQLNQLIEEIPFHIIATVIDKRRLKEKYFQPHSPYETALKFCLERAYFFLKELAVISHATNLIVEQRGLTEDKDLELAFRRIIGKSGNMHKEDLPFELIHANKKTNSCGLQIADLVAHPIGRYVINTRQENRSFKILEKKIIGKNGKIDGYGLKVFPKL